MGFPDRAWLPYPPLVSGFNRALAMRDCRSPRRTVLLFFRPGEVGGLTRPYPSQDRASRRRTAVRRQLQDCGPGARSRCAHKARWLLWRTASSSRFLSMERLRRRLARLFRQEAPPIARTDLRGYQLGLVSVVLFVGRDRSSPVVWSPGAFPVCAPSVALPHSTTSLKRPGAWCAPGLSGVGLSSVPILIASTGANRAPCLARQL